MRLIELSSTRSSFKTVRFNRTGLSLIVGKHTVKQAKNIRSTYNGVGKSLLVALLHFCLGASKNRHFDAHLEGWDFTLTFEHDDKQHRVTRTVGEDAIHLDGQEYRLETSRKYGKGYKETLNEIGVFDLPADVSGLSFRSLINFFLRPVRSSYISPDGAVTQWTPYFRVLYQSFLLGLDYCPVVKKHEDKKRLDEQLVLAKRYKEDKDLREYYLGEKNAEMELASLNERIATLEADLASFQVAKDYSEREEAANALHARIADARGEEAILAVRHANIDEAMSIRPDVTPERVKRLYAEAEFVLPAAVVKRLDEVDAFHARLRENRLKRLQQERNATEEKLRGWQAARTEMERELDGLLQYLKAHRARRVHGKQPIPR